MPSTGRAGGPPAAAGDQGAGMSDTSGGRPLLVSGDRACWPSCPTGGGGRRRPEVVGRAAVADVRRSWGTAPLVLVGDDCAEALASCGCRAVTACCCSTGWRPRSGGGRCGQAPSRSARFRQTVTWWLTCWVPAPTGRPGRRSCAWSAGAVVREPRSSRRRWRRRRRPTACAACWSTPTRGVAGSTCWWVASRSTGCAGPTWPRRRAG